MKWRCCFDRQMLGYCCNPQKMKREFVFLLFKECFPHRFLGWSAKHCKVLPSHCNTGVQPSTEQGLRWKHRPVREGSCRRRAPVKHLVSSFPGKAERSLSGTREPRYWPGFAKSGCSWNSQRSISAGLLCQLHSSSENVVSGKLFKTAHFRSTGPLVVLLVWGAGAGRVITWWKSKKTHFHGQLLH